MDTNIKSNKYQINFEINTIKKIPDNLLWKKNIQ